MLVIGVDCATVAEKTGLALAEYEAGRLSVRDVVLGTRERPAATIISGWLQDAAEPALLALDAPLGWPEAMGRVLVGHAAGEPIEEASNEFFRRETDRHIQRTLHKTPLDVGADRIARTAHAALELLGSLRDKLALPIPLAWGLPLVGVSAIEVYPAATLHAYGFRSSGYKRSENTAERRDLLVSLAGLLDIGADRKLLERSADALDAVVCTLAAKDFLEGRAVPPEDLALAQREGWIWVRPQNTK